MAYTHRATIISITLSNPDSTALVTNIWARRMGGRRSTLLKAFEYIPPSWTAITRGGLLPGITYGALHRDERETHKNCSSPWPKTKFVNIKNRFCADIFPSLDTEADDLRRRTRNSAKRRKGYSPRFPTSD